MSPWGTGQADVERLIREGKVQRVQASRELADAMLVQARRHLTSARAIQGDDPAGAFQMVYDAARKALAAILETQGLRVRGGEGGHATVLDVVVAQLHPPHAHPVHEFTWLRRTRNATEYPSLDRAVAGPDDVDDALPIAEEIVALAEKMVPLLPVF